MAIKISGNTVIDDSRNITSSGTMSANAYIGDGSQLTNLPGGGNTLEATASGTLADGSKVIVNADGTVSVVTKTETTGPGLGTPEVFESATIYSTSATFDSTNNRVVIAYQDNGNSSYGTAVVGQVTGTDISFGTPEVFNSDSTTYISATFDSSNGKVVIFYRDSGNSGKGTAKVGTVDTSDNSIDFGSASVFRHAQSEYMSAVYDSTNGKVVVAFRDQGASGAGTAVVGQVSGTGISFGSYNAFESNQAESISATFDSTNGKVVIAYNDANSAKGEAVVGTVNAGNNTIAYGSIAEFNSSDSGFVSAVYDSTNQRVVIAYRDHGNSLYGTAIVGQVTGTNITFGSESLFKSARADVISATFDSTNGKVVISYSDPGNSDYGTLVTGTVDTSDNSISFGSHTVYESATTYFIATTFDSTNGKAVIAYSDYGNSNHGTAIVFSNTGFSVPQIGTSVDWETVDHTYFSSAVYDSTNNKVIAAYWATRGSQYGYGTAAVGTVSGTSISFGTPVTFNSDYTRDIRLAYDSTNDRVVIAFKNSSNYYGKAVVGQVSGTSISFGSPVTFASSNTNTPSPVYDSTNNKVVIVYEDVGNSSHGKAIVGEISGNNISFPSSSVTFNSSASYYIGATFDSTNGKVVVAFSNYGASGHGSAIVLEVSGTTINYGSPVKFVTSLVDLPCELVHDSVNNKIVILYRNSGDSTYYGTAVVGTVSGTSISFNGSATVFSATQVGFYSIAYDSTNGKVIAIFKDGSTSSGTAIVGTVSGNNISFGSSFEIESGGISYLRVVYDSSNDKAVAVYNDEGNQYRVTATVFTPFTLTTNLTSENYIGISDGSYTNGQSATIQLAGSVDDAQSGLTPGSKYYVQGNGTLSTTADSPSVFAGTAVATTKLIVKN